MPSTRWIAAVPICSKSSPRRATISRAIPAMPSGGNVVATNDMYNIAPKDGTMIATINNGIPLHQMIDDRGVRYDADKFNWLGSTGAVNAVTIAWHTAGIRTIQDVLQREVVLG